MRTAQGVYRAARDGNRVARRVVRTQARQLALAIAAAASVLDPQLIVVSGTVDETVVGFGVVTLEHLRNGETLGRILDLFVEPGARSVGVGEAMADDLVAFCATHRCTGIDAVALPGHRATKNFFEESGFTARALVMHRSLDRSEREDE